MHRYEKVSIEHTVKKGDTTKMMRLLSMESDEFQSLMDYPSSTDYLREWSMSTRKSEIRSWLGSKKKDGAYLLDVYVHKETPGCIFIVELADIKNLWSDFGRKRHTAQGYPCIYAYGRDETFGPIKERFHEFYRSQIKEVYGLSDLPDIIPICVVNKTFDPLKKKYAEQSFSTEVESDIIALLRDSTLRSIVIRTKQGRGATIENIAKLVGQTAPEIEAHVLEAEQHGILVPKCDVKCESCGKAIARVSSKDSVNRLAEEGTHCPRCNLPISSDGCETVYVVSADIAELLDGSKWMSVDLKNELTKLGFLDGNVLLEIQDGPNELDVVANIEGTLVLMECKDSQFSIGHAYSFVGKCTKYRPELAFVIVTGGIGPEVRDYLEATQIGIHYVEDLDDLHGILERVFGELHARSLLGHVTSMPLNAMLMKTLAKALDFSLEKTQGDLFIYDEYARPTRRYDRTRKGRIIFRE